MAISIEVNEIPDLEIKKSMESVIRDGIGDRPTEEDWKVWIRASGCHREVVVQGPTQTRRRFFFDDIHTLPEKIGNWLETYPFR